MQNTSLLNITICTFSFICVTCCTICLLCAFCKMNRGCKIDFQANADTAEYAEINGAPKIYECTSSETVTLSTKPMTILNARYSLLSYIAAVQCIFFMYFVAHISLFELGLLLFDRWTKVKK